MFFRHHLDFNLVRGAADQAELSSEGQEDMISKCVEARDSAMRRTQRIY